MHIPNIKFQSLEKFLLIIIVLLGAFLYLYKLDTNPPGIYLDEAGTGYNIYSILKTGKDEYGKFLPLAFRLFGSYTPPLYIYLSVPLMAIFGFSIFSTRLLSAISGIFAIYFFYFIIKELEITKSKFTPIIATAFFAITPWLVYFSRVGYEQNLAFLFFLISVLLIAKTIKNPIETFGRDRVNLVLKNKNPKRIKTKPKKKEKDPKYCLIKAFI